MTLPKLLIAIGFSLVGLGLIVLAAQRVPWVCSWFGHLPGDLRYEGERTFVYAPITSMLVVSIALSVLLWLVKLFMDR